MITKQCLMCDDDFEVPYYQRNSISTCSKYCKNRKLTISKLKGVYLQCNYCDKALFRTKAEIKKYNFCSKNCDINYRKNVTVINKYEKLLENRKIYYGSEFRELSRLVRKEQDFKCLDCNISEDEYSKKLSIHHIKEFITFDSIEEANKRDNLVAICEPCHRKRHSGDNHRVAKHELGLNSKSVYGKTTLNQKNKAIEIVNLLINTDLKIHEIVKKLNCSRTTVVRIYKGERWTELYASPPIITNPRKTKS